MLVIGRVVDIAGGKATIEAFPQAKKPLTDREQDVIKAAIAFVTKTENGVRANSEYRTLHEAVLDL